MTSFFKQYASGPKPNRAQRRKRAKERRRQSRQATRAWQREQDAKRAAMQSETKGDE